MSQPKTVRRLIRELEAYFRTYGDAPVYLAIGTTITPLTDNAVGTMGLDDGTEETSVTVNAVILCDPEAYAEAQRKSDENDSLVDSTCGE